MYFILIQIHKKAALETHIYGESFSNHTDEASFIHMCIPCFTLCISWILCRKSYDTHFISCYNIEVLRAPKVYIFFHFQTWTVGIIRDSYIWIKLADMKSIRAIIIDLWNNWYVCSRNVTRLSQEVVPLSSELLSINDN